MEKNNGLIVFIHSFIPFIGSIVWVFDTVGMYSKARRSIGNIDKGVLL
jgi:hypothetical protein